MKVSVIGIDLGKNFCSLAGMDETGRVVFRKRASRSGVIEIVGKLPGCTVAMEACCGAHHLGRVFPALGHEIRLMSPEYVQPYVKAQKMGWLPPSPDGMLARNHKNVAVVALANKLARICWAVLIGQRAFVHETKPAH